MGKLKTKFTSSFVVTIGIIKRSDHKKVRFKVYLNLERERAKIVERKKPSLLSVRAKADEFRLRLQKKFAPLADQYEYSLGVINTKLTNVISESGLAVGRMES